jgi:hypothetical protein
MDVGAQAACVVLADVVDVVDGVEIAAKLYGGQRSFHYQLVTHQNGTYEGWNPRC